MTNTHVQARSLISFYGELGFDLAPSDIPEFEVFGDLVPIVVKGGIELAEIVDAAAKVYGSGIRFAFAVAGKVQTLDDPRPAGTYVMYAEMEDTPFDRYFHASCRSMRERLHGGYTLKENILRHAYTLYSKHLYADQKAPSHCLGSRLLDGTVPTLVWSCPECADRHLEVRAVDQDRVFSVIRHRKILIH